MPAVTFPRSAGNRMVSRGGNATYVYDGQGNLVKKMEGGSTIVYVGGIATAGFPDVAFGNVYEKNVTSGEVTKY